MKAHFLRRALAAALATGILTAAWAEVTLAEVASRLNALGLDPVKITETAAGGVLQGTPGGKNVIFAATDLPFALRILSRVKSQSHPGDLIFVYGTGVKLKRGDFVVRTELTPSLPKGQVALPSRGPSIDEVEYVLSPTPDGPPLLVVASAVVLALQSQAQTANTAVMVHMDSHENLDNGLKVRLSVRIFDPQARTAILQAVEASARKSVALEKVKLASYEVHPVENSGRWPKLRERLAKTLTLEPIFIDVPDTAFAEEQFGRPAAPSVTLTIGEGQDDQVDRAVSGLLLTLLSDSLR